MDDCSSLELQLFSIGHSTSEALEIQSKQFQETHHNLENEDVNWWP